MKGFSTGKVTNHVNGFTITLASAVHRCVFFYRMLVFDGRGTEVLERRMVGSRIPDSDLELSLVGSEMSRVLDPDPFCDLKFMIRVLFSSSHCWIQVLFGSRHCLGPDAVWVQLLV